MASIVWDTDVNAPGAAGKILGEKQGDEILVQTDWDFPGVAQSFGWSIRSVQKCNQCDADRDQGERCPDCDNEPDDCDHDGTDGTVDCPDCGVSVGAFMAAAEDWLRANDGAVADDPGYFA